MNADQAQKTLASINGIIALVNPLLGGALAFGESIIQEFRSQGADVGPFADEIARFDQAVAGGITADDAWRARHGLAPWGSRPQPAAPQPPPAPQPAPQPPAPPAQPGNGGSDAEPGAGFPVGGGTGQG